MSELLHITRAAELVNLPELILVAECELGRLPHIVTADGVDPWPTLDKTEVAERLVALIATRLETTP